MAETTLVEAEQNGAMTVRPLVLNHVEMIYRRGETEHAQAFFETLGFTVTQWEAWLFVNVSPDGNGIDNVMYANQPTPAQQNFNDAFDAAVANDPRLAETLARSHAVAREWPYYNFHFGASIPTHEDWQERVDRLQDASKNHPLLKGRIEVVVKEPTTPRALTAQSQCFVFTDILAAGGPFAQGLQFELQWTPTPPSGVINSETVAAIGPGNPFPEMSTLT
jgi:hypothetical protein